MTTEPERPIVIVGCDGAFTTGLIRFEGETPTDWCQIEALPPESKSGLSERYREIELANRLYAIVKEWGADYFAAEMPRPEYAALKAAYGNRAKAKEAFNQTKVTVHLGRLAADFANAAGRAGAMLIQVEPGAGHRALTGSSSGDKKKILKMARLRYPQLRGLLEGQHHIADAAGIVEFARSELNAARAGSRGQHTT